MAGVNVKMGVTGVSEFKRSMKDSESAVKSLNAQLALNESQLKLNGNSELYMENKVALLNQKISAQAAIAKSAKAALEDMRKNGVAETSSAFQTMQTKLYNATNEMVKTKTELQNVKNGTDGAKNSAKEMNTELQKIGKGISWENVTNGIHSVTQSLESAGRAAINAGRKLLNSFTGATSWADDVTTRATKYGVSTEEIQRMDQAADIIDTDVDTIISARNKLANGKGLEELLGIDTTGMNLEDQFWAAGDAIMAMTDEAERADKAQDVFGKSWMDLVPLFTAGREAYEAALEGASVLSDEQVAALSSADDTIKQLETQVENLKRSFWAENADNITSLMQWLIDNKNGVVAALTAIGVAFAGLKIAEFATSLTKIVNGFKTLSGLGGAGNGLGLPQMPVTTGTGGTGTGGFGTALAGAGYLAVAVMTVAPAVEKLFDPNTWKQSEIDKGVQEVQENTPTEIIQEANKNAGVTNQDLLSTLFNRATYTGGDASGLTVKPTGNTGTSGGHSFGDETATGGELIYKDRRNVTTFEGGEVVTHGNTLETAAEEFGRMSEVAGEMNTATTNQANASSDLSAAAKDMTGLPELMKAAVQTGAQAGVSGIKVLLDGQAVGTLVAGYVSEAVAASIIGR